MDFSKVSGSKRASKFDNIIRAFGRTAEARRTTYDKDETFWYPERDSEGNAQATIRFLPGLQSENEPVYVDKYSHGYKSPTGQWFIENCPTTLPDGKCPVCANNGRVVEENGGQWETLTKTVKDYVGLRKRKLQYTTNVLVINDKANPENNGRIFKFNFGKRIYDKIHAKLNPEFDDVQPVNVFDVTEGANFRLSVCKKDGFVNYDKSEFDNPSKLAKDVIARLETDQHEILPIHAESNFKSWDELLAKFLKVEKRSGQAPPPIAQDQQPSDSTQSNESTEEAFPPVQENIPSDEPVDETSMDTEEDDYFSKLASEVG